MLFESHIWQVIHIFQASVSACKMGGGFVSGYVWGLPAVSPVYPTINFWNKGKWEWGLGHLLFEIIEGLQYHMCSIFRTFVVNWRHNQWAREILPSRKMHGADSFPICSWDKCEYAKCCFCQASWCDVSSQTLQWGESAAAEVGLFLVGRWQLPCLRPLTGLLFQ